MTRRSRANHRHLATASSEQPGPLSQGEGGDGELNCERPSGNDAAWILHQWSAVGRAKSCPATRGRWLNLCKCGEFRLQSLPARRLRSHARMVISCVEFRINLSFIVAVAARANNARAPTYETL